MELIDECYKSKTKSYYRLYGDGVVSISLFCNDIWQGYGTGA